MPDRILRAISHPTIDHRGPEFGALGRQVLAGVPLRASGVQAAPAHLQATSAAVAGMPDRTDAAQRSK